MPGKPQIAGDVLQARQGRGNLRTDLETEKLRFGIAHVLNLRSAAQRSTLDARQSA
jgi:hypothetical protein